MATYVCSDIHGEYDLYIKLLNAIDFSDEDKMYILGDIIDKGGKSLILVDFLIKHKNIKCIMGNHEDSFLKYYDNVMHNYTGTNQNEILKSLQLYFPFDNFSISWDIVDYIESLPYYIETKDFIGVHAGLEIDEDNNIYPLNEQPIQYMLFDRNFKTAKINNFGKPILFGHTPCSYDNQTGYFIKEPNINSKSIKDYIKIRLDNGCQFTKILGTLRIDDMKEIYVK